MNRRLGAGSGCFRRSPIAVCCSDGSQVIIRRHRAAIATQLMRRSAQGQVTRVGGQLFNFFIGVQTSKQPLKFLFVHAFFARFVTRVLSCFFFAQSCSILFYSVAYPETHHRVVLCYLECCVRCISGPSAQWCRERALSHVLLLVVVVAASACLPGVLCVLCVSAAVTASVVCQCVGAGGASLSIIEHCSLSLLLLQSSDWLSAWLLGYEIRSSLSLSLSLRVLRYAIYNGGWHVWLRMRFLTMLSAVHTYSAVWWLTCTDYSAVAATTVTCTLHRLHHGQLSCTSLTWLSGDIVLVLCGVCAGPRC